jgi:hypothetical protein
VTKDPFTLPRPPAVTLPDAVKTHLALTREQLKALPTAPPTASSSSRQFSPQARRARETLATVRQNIAASEAALRQEITAREALLPESAAREAALRQEIAGRKEQLRALEAWAEQFGIPPPAPLLPADPSPADPSPVDPPSRPKQKEGPIDHARRARRALWPEGDPGRDKLLLKTAVEDVNIWLTDEARLSGRPPPPRPSPDTVSRALGRRK